MAQADRKLSRGAGAGSPTNGRGQLRQIRAAPLECEQTACHGRTRVEAILASPPHTTGPLGADRFAGCRLAPSHAVGAEQAQPELVEEGARLVGCEEGVERVSTAAQARRGSREGRCAGTEVSRCYSESPSSFTYRASPVADVLLPTKLFTLSAAFPPRRRSCFRFGVLCM